MLFDYTYNLILQTGQSPISSDYRRSTVIEMVVSEHNNFRKGFYKPNEDIQVIPVWGR